MKDKKEKKEKTKFNLAFDNLAIPEVHIGGNAHGQGNVEHKHPDAYVPHCLDHAHFLQYALPGLPDYQMRD